MAMDATNYKNTKYNKPFILQNADPYVYKHVDGGYWYTATVPTYDKILLRKSNTIDGLSRAEEVVIWEKHQSGIMSEHVWAPELHYLDGRWFIYFAAGDKDNIWEIRPYVLMCEGDDPLKDPWMEMGMMQSADEFSFNDFSLDGTVFENRGKRYFVWAEKVNIGKKISNIYIAEMETPLKLATKQVLISSPDYDWERVDFWVNEGPAVVHHGGKIFLTYSASATGDCYCMGMLSINEEEDLLDPCAWKKERYPILRSDVDKGIFGPGHNSFTKSEDGTEDIMIYHARQYDTIIGNPLYDANRHVFRMKVNWNAKGNPIFDYNNNF